MDIYVGIIRCQYQQIKCVSNMLNQFIQEISTGLIQKVAVWGFQHWVNPLEEKWQNHCGYKPEWTATRLMSHPNFNNESPTVAITAACITFCCLLETVPFVVHATCSVSVFADAFFFFSCRWCAIRFVKISSEFQLVLRQFACRCHRKDTPE